MSYSAAFCNAFYYTMNFEVGSAPDGGYVNDPNDPGGETKYGIAKRYNPDLDIKNLTVQQAMDVYYKRYWKPLQLDAIASGRISAEIFDTAVNGGVGTAAQIAQGALILLGRNVALDAKMGPKTIEAINEYPYIETFLQTLNGLQFMMYVLGGANTDEIIQMIRERKSHVQRYLRGWSKRLKLETI
jgi:lysozyme family protein